MLGFLYIIICVFTGYAICSMAFPKLNEIVLKTYKGKDLMINPYFLVLPAWFLIGTLVVTWIVYIVAYFFRSYENPLMYANSFVIPFFLVFSFVIYKKNKNDLFMRNKERVNTGLSLADILFLILIIGLSVILMWTTFFVKDNNLYVGVSVFSDFSPHIGMIRSFSVGNNYPTQYSHYAGQDIRYHFMFQFLVGNLEYLGLRIDSAFNIPSIVGLVSTFLLLYVLSIKITGKRSVGYITCLLFAFRSSESFFTYLSEIPKGTSIWKTLSQNTEFIGYTPNENWGLWNLNVYCNQRHLAFSISMLILVILLFLPHLYEMFEALNNKRSLISESLKINNNHKTQQLGVKKLWMKETMYTLFWDREGWVVKDIRLSVATGILLGVIAFWNGAVLIAALSILFFIAVFSKKRLEFLIMAIIAVSLSYIQANVFIQGEAVSPNFYFGFIASNPTIFGALAYLKKLTGLLSIVLFAAFILDRGIKKWIIISFMAPIILAFTLSLTVDVTVNHKYIMISVMLLGIIAADFLVLLFQKKDFWYKLSCILILIVLISTGVYDFTTILRKNRPSTAIVLELESNLTSWVIKHASSKDIFLTSNYAINQFVLGGAMLYQGWQYFAWSAGYDTAARDEQVKLMYEAGTPDILKQLSESNNIRFIVVDYDNRSSEAYELNETTIRNTYVCVYQEGEGEGMTSIYDTSLPIK
jgi:hypothetical protein